MAVYLLTLTLLASVHTSQTDTPSEAPSPDVPLVETPSDVAEDVPATEKPQLIVLELDAIDVDEDQVRVITGRIADVLGREEAFVTLTSTDLSQMLGVVAERQSLGCDTDACIAEIAAAFGARYVVYGRVARVSELLLLQLSLFDSEAAKPISRREIEGESLRALLDATAGASKDLVLPLLGDGATAYDSDAAGGWSPGALFWSGAGIGVAGAATAAGLGIWAGVLYSQLLTTGGSVPRTAKDFAQASLPWVAAGAGAAGVVGVIGAGVLAADFLIE